MGIGARLSSKIANSKHTHARHLRTPSHIHICSQQPHTSHIRCIYTPLLSINLHLIRNQKTTNTSLEPGAHQITYTHLMQPNP